MEPRVRANDSIKIRWNYQLPSQNAGMLPYCLFFMLVPVILLPPTSLSQAGTLAHQDIQLEGTASGGTLVLSTLLNNNGVNVWIETNYGESALSVMSRLAMGANQSSEFVSRFGRIRMKGGAIELIGSQENGAFAFGGTEKGLGIPPGPTNVTIRGLPHSNAFDISWRNPDEGFDSVTLVVDGVHAHHLPGNATQYKSQAITMAPKEILVTVVGYRNGIPSNAGGVVASSCVQQDILAVPFTRGVAPNWSLWSGPGSEGKVIPEQAERALDGVALESDGVIRKPEQKPLYQSFTLAEKSAVGGVVREFLGLTPGHAYRVSTRMSAGDSDAVSGPWSLSFHVAPRRSDASPLTPEELAGLVPIRGRSPDFASTQIARLTRDTSQPNRWEPRSTGDTREDNRAADIALPEGMDTLVVWFRAEGSVPPRAGFDSVTLEDLDCLAVRNAPMQPMSHTDWDKPGSPFKSPPKAE
ncbi:MAG: hypothetical protein GHCLOJNM_01232 [bacterium]|nr:hypothetical protein [bacterium]